LTKVLDSSVQLFAADWKADKQLAASLELKLARPELTAVAKFGQVVALKVPVIEVTSAGVTF